MTQGIRPDGQIFASQAVSGELEDFPAETRGWGVTVDGNDGAGNKVTDPTDGIPPMEWMNGILNKLSAQIFWNMRHAIPAWATGAWDAGAFITYSGWVYYNASTAETSETPGSGSAWVKLFPLSGMDGRYLEISKNLEEIAAEGATAQGEARDNLGLKSAATHDVTTSHTDETAGHVLQVGDFGLGSVAPRTSVVASNNYDLIPTDLPSGYWTHVVSGGPFAYTFTLYQDGGAAKQSRHLIIPSSPTGKIAFRWDGATATGSKDYQYFYTDKNKPTAADVGALPIIGGTLTGNLEISDGAPLLTFTDTNQIPVKKYIFVCDGGDFRLDEDSTTGNNVWKWSSLTNELTINGELVPSNYANFDAKYQKINTASKAANGWFKDTNTGMIFQWGHNTSSVVGNATVTFPIAFPNACLNVQNSWIRGANNPGENPWGFVSSFNNTTASITGDANGSYWFAMGY